MPLELPGSKPTRKIRTTPKAKSVDSLAPQDVIEYGLTQEVSPGPGRKAWIKFGVMSSVRDEETSEEAMSRVVSYVNTEIDRRIDELG